MVETISRSPARRSQSRMSNTFVHFVMLGRLAQALASKELDAWARCSLIGRALGTARLYQVDGAFECSPCHVVVIAVCDSIEPARGSVPRVL